MNQDLPGNPTRSPRIHYRLALSCLLFAACCWGTSFVSIALSLRELPPSSIGWLRLFPALLVLGGYAGWQRARTVLRVQTVPATSSISFDSRLALRCIGWRNGLWLAAASLFGTVFYGTLENSGLQYTTPATAAMLTSAIPIFVLICEILFCRHPLRPYECLAVLVSILGVYWVLFDGALPDFSHAHFRGNLRVLGAMACWVAYTFIVRRLGRMFSDLAQTACQFVLATVFFLPFVWLELPRWHMPSLTVGFNLLLLGVCSSGLSYLAYLYGVRVLGTVIPSLSLNLVPVVTIFYTWALFGEVPGIYQLAGAGLVIAGFSTIAWFSSRQPLADVGA